MSFEELKKVGEAIKARQKKLIESGELIKFGVHPGMTSEQAREATNLFKTGPDKIASYLQKPSTIEKIAGGLEYGHEMLKWYARNPKMLVGPVLAATITGLGAQMVKDRYNKNRKDD